MCNQTLRDDIQVDILIGHTVPLYQEVLAATLHAMRPHLVVRQATPDELRHLACQLRPALVICSSAGEIPSQCAEAWAVLYPDDRDEIVVTTAQSSRTISHASISVLLDLVDLRPDR
jgi:glycerate-2-kinase